MQNSRRESLNKLLKTIDFSKILEEFREKVLDDLAKPETDDPIFVLEDVDSCTESMDAIHGMVDAIEERPVVTRELLLKSHYVALLTGVAVAIDHLTSKKPD